ncbi:substrate-binding periplasmic protein [Shewanella polaris]|uniref:Transporter substrate-binding domain-containing protein n=1 Tax=Shewanella polaris TaxID=2588449 RepID=A0A4Y5YHE1_9GAMM|nr:transporter substrate-binding domain-containing protein [Shewanella polaris]QDE32221.1 transporter substrate-binding domain-containing protein [Shewanella polaris]
MRKYYRIYLLYWLITCCFTVNAQTILKYNVNASNGWIPYFISNSPDNPGIIGELVPLILSQANISIENHNFPPKRTNYALENGLLDFDIVSPSWFENQDLGDDFTQSIPILTIQENIITLDKNAHKWQDINQIKDKRIGTIRGYLYHNDTNFIRVDFASERELIKALHRERVSAAISGDLPALYWAKQLNIPITLAAIHSKGELVLRLRKQHAILLPQINAAIIQLQQNGAVNKMINKYTKKRSI